MKRLLLLVGLVLLAALYGGLTGQGTSPRELPVSVREQGRGLTLMNYGPDRLSGCTVTVNGSFRAEDVSIPAGDRSDVWFSELRAGSLRFEPAQERLRRVSVTCSIPRREDTTYIP